MVPQPEQQARNTIDDLLVQAGWSVCDATKANIHASRGVAIREFPLRSGQGFADYLIRTIVRTFRDKLFTEIYPGRTWAPKTLLSSGAGRKNDESDRHRPY